MRNPFAIKGAMKIVDDCSSIRDQENVLVVTDFDTFIEAKLIAEAAISRGGDCHNRSNAC